MEINYILHFSKSTLPWVLMQTREPLVFMVKQSGWASRKLNKQTTCRGTLQKTKTLLTFDKSLTWSFLEWKTKKKSKEKVTKHCVTVKKETKSQTWSQLCSCKWIYFGIHGPWRAVLDHESAKCFKKSPKKCWMWLKVPTIFLGV